MKKLYNNIKINYAFLFFKNLNSSNGIWMLYLASKGLTLFQIGLLEAIFHVTSFIMETPTGAIADIFGRKASRLVGICLSIVSSVLMIVSNSFWFFALSFVFCALSYNFESGAAEALIYDSLKIENNERKFMKITGNNEVIYQTTQVIALIIGGFIGNIKFAYVYYLAIALAVITFAIGLFFKEPKSDMPKEQKIKITFEQAIKNQYTDSFRAVKGNTKLIYLILFTSMLLASVTLSFYYLQIALKDIGFSVLKIGIYLSVSSVFAAAGAIFAEKIEKKIGERAIMKAVPPIMGAMIILFVFVKYSIIPFAILSFVEALLFVATRDYINKLIESDKRATILSFDSMMFSFFMISTFPLFGLLSDYIHIKNAFLVFGGIIFMISLINLKIKIKE